MIDVSRLNEIVVAGEALDREFKSDRRREFTDRELDSTRRLVRRLVQRLVRRWTLPNGAPRSFLSLPSVFKNCRDVAAELLGHPLTCSVNRVDNRVTIRRVLNHRPPFLPACR